MSSGVCDFDYFTNLNLALFLKCYTLVICKLPLLGNFEIPEF